MVCVSTPTSSMDGTRPPHHVHDEQAGFHSARSRSRGRTPRCSRNVGDTQPAPMLGGGPAGLFDPTDYIRKFAAGSCVPTTPEPPPDRNTTIHCHPGCPIRDDLQSKILPLLQEAYGFARSAYEAADRASVASTEALVQSIKAGERVSRAVLIMSSHNPPVPTTPGF